MLKLKGHCKRIEEDNMELDDQVHNQIVKLCNLGDSQVEDNQFEKGIDNYLKALDLIPNPKIEWEASTWIYTEFRRYLLSLR